MKCPVFRQDVEFVPERIKYTAKDCLKEECAWWDDKNKRCSVVTIARKLDFLHSVAKDIRDKMPHAGQFTKYRHKDDSATQEERI